MRILKATIEYAKKISDLMLSDLEKPNSKFPKEMINRFREHAKEENIIKEFENSNLIAFISKNGDNTTGFIIGYEDNVQKNAMIHYIKGNKIEKKELLQNFIKECKLRKLNRIITDTFEFMSNNVFFKSNGFFLTKKEKITPNLEMLWYELNLN
jgi:hypothetical protein